jgi:hypothetical protein
MEHYQRFTLGNVIVNFEHVAYITRDAGDTVTIHLALNNGAPLNQLTVPDPDGKIWERHTYGTHKVADFIPEIS